MRKRNRESFLCTARFSIANEIKKYLHSELMLYFPLHHKDEIKDSFATYEDQYHTVKDIVEHNAQYFNQIGRTLIMS